MDYPVFVVPGIGSSGPLHWQSVWQAAYPDWQRLAVADWDYVVCNDWVSALEGQLAANARETVIVAHSLGCLAVVHWAARYARTIRGALLVAVPDPASPAFPRVATSGFAPLPSERLPFPTTVVSSINDPYGSFDHARVCAMAWGSELVEVGAKGHLNADSNLGDWPEGFQLLMKMNDG
ncbi:MULTISPECIES: RBBP9/YdeN family alpha/beta hydrolase [Paraburkholderia]|uniref:RBBP9/YdeN family alpha/beta hydrolase n=1 Tax=Paraburkholderia TaxID=1822464 RepID=UPI00036E8F0C|nr:MULTISPECIES: alpha/beta hydrolase [Paraburkholderia]MDH6146448.1 putative alpha/beta hydrolase family esterase [Paraburkholderia sp. WSM4179]